VGVVGVAGAVRGTTSHLHDIGVERAARDVTADQWAVGDTTSQWAVRAMRRGIGQWAARAM